jgi:hypothetical protein
MFLVNPAAPPNAYHHHLLRKKERIAQLIIKIEASQLTAPNQPPSLWLCRFSLSLSLSLSHLRRSIYIYFVLYEDLETKKKLKYIYVDFDRSNNNYIVGFVKCAVFLRF